MKRSAALSAFVLTCIAGFAGCMPAGTASYVRLAEYLHSPQGFEEWQRGEADLKQELDRAAERYRREHSMEALRTYEAAVREYLDHGRMLYQAYQAVGLPLPKGLERSLVERTDELMDIADAYLKQGSTAMGVGIAREVILKYTDIQKMTHAQRRAEQVLLKYRYRQDY